MNTFTLLFGCGLVYGGFLFASQLLSGQRIERETSIDKFRRECKEDGLVLHLPSYREGIEGYIEPKWQNTPLLVKEHLRRF
jgi:hypothetical protein